MQRIAASSFFPVLASYVFPNESIEQVRQRVAAYTTTEQFQRDTMYRVNERIIANTITHLSCEGFERLDAHTPYLYVSNHRDIMLDASLLQNLLLDHGFDTTEITFGANLMMNQLVVDIGKSNKMFRVERPGGSIRDFYNGSLHLSQYIRDTLCRRGQSVWIAQRNGRTKDGRDATDQGIVKMFCMSKAEDKVAALDELHIVPMAISYEWETCDVLKTLELYASQFARYTKKPGEDLNSILTGIVQPKGHVHIALCEPISTNELQRLEPLTANAYHTAVAEIIDSRIHQAYHLHPTNYIAHDLRQGSQRWHHHYTPEQKAAFVERLRELDRYDSCDIEQLRDILIGIYANPVDKKMP